MTQTEPSVFSLQPVEPAPPTVVTDMVGDTPLPEPEPAPEEPAAPPAEPETFDRKYVEDLRKEAANYRTKLRDLEQVFDGYDEDAQAALREFLKDPNDPANQLKAVEALGLTADEEPTTVPPSAVDYAAIARREAEAALSAYQEAQNQREAVVTVQSTAKGLGYEPDSPDYVLLLKFANDMETPDLAAAHQQVQAWKRAQWDEFIASKETEAAGSPIVGTDGSAPSTTQTPKTWAQARESLHERLGRI